MGRTTLLLLALGLGAGCVHLPWQKHESMASSKSADQKPRRSVAKVSAHQINEKNAHQMAQTLQNELDHAKDPPEPDPVPATKK